MERPHFTEDRDLIAIMANVLDYPSVYMGGPSNHNQRKIANLLDALIEAGYSIVKTKTLTEK